ncbi:MAG: hypothetical protein NVS9B13_13010 [Candidatus Acidiferrum sp.]
MQIHKLGKGNSLDTARILGCFAVVAILIFCIGVTPMQAQAPNPAAAGPVTHSPEGFTPGWGAGARFEGSSSGDGVVYDLGTGAGYNFTSHFGVDLGVPFYFVNSASSIKQKNPSALSGIGVGSIGANVKFLFPMHVVNYASTVHLTAPTGDVKKGLSNGHATWNWSNHIEHAWGNFTPFIDGGVGNSVLDSRYFHRPFTTFGYAAQFEAGTEIDAFGPFSVTVSAYDVAPIGSQTVISRVFRCGTAGTCTTATNSTNRHGYTLSSIQTGGADLVRDNGFNAGVEVKPLRYLDLEFDFSRSVPLQLNSFSFAVSVDFRSLYKSTKRH